MEFFQKSLESSDETTLYNEVISFRNSLLIEDQNVLRNLYSFYEDNAKSTEIFSILDKCIQQQWNKVMPIYWDVIRLLLKLTNTPLIKSVGIRIARKLLRNYMKYIYRVLSDSDVESLQVMLGLLTTINEYGEIMVNDVMEFFDLTIKGSFYFAGCFGRKRKDLPSVRELYIRFVLLVLEHGSSANKTKMLKVKEFVGLTFKHIQKDSLETVELMLKTFEEKLLLDEKIHRSVKVSLFNSYAIDQLMVIYAKIPDRIQSFLLFLCTNPCGIGYRDSEWTTKTETNNKVILHLLLKLDIQESTNVYELAQAILHANSDLQGFYFRKCSLEVDSKKIDTLEWMINTSFLLKVLQNEIVLNVTEKVNESTLMDWIYPFVLQKSIMNKNLLSTDETIRNQSLLLIHAILTRYSSFELKSLKPLMLKGLPDFQVFIKIATKLSDDYRPFLLDIFYFFKERFPEIVDDSRFNYAKLISLSECEKVKKATLRVLSVCIDSLSWFSQTDSSPFIYVARLFEYPNAEKILSNILPLVLDAKETFVMIQVIRMVKGNLSHLLFLQRCLYSYRSSLQETVEEQRQKYLNSDKNSNKDEIEKLCQVILEELEFLEGKRTSVSNDIEQMLSYQLTKGSIEEKEYPYDIASFIIDYLIVNYRETMLPMMIELAKKHSFPLHHLTLNTIEEKMLFVDYLHDMKESFSHLIPDLLEDISLSKSLLLRILTPNDYVQAVALLQERKEFEKCYVMLDMYIEKKEWANEEIMISKEAMLYLLNDSNRLITIATMYYQDNAIFQFEVSFEKLLSIEDYLERKHHDLLALMMRHSNFIFRKMESIQKQLSDDLFCSFINAATCHSNVDIDNESSLRAISLGCYSVLSLQKNVYRLIKDNKVELSKDLLLQLYNLPFDKKLAKYIGKKLFKKERYSNEEKLRFLQWIYPNHVVDVDDFIDSFFEIDHSFLMYYVYYMKPTMQQTLQKTIFKLILSLGSLECLKLYVQKNLFLSNEMKRQIVDLYSGTIKDKLVLEIIKQMGGAFGNEMMHFNPSSEWVDQFDGSKVYQTMVSIHNPTDDMYDPFFVLLWLHHAFESFSDAIDCRSLLFKNLMGLVLCSFHVPHLKNLAYSVFVKFTLTILPSASFREKAQVSLLFSTLHSSLSSSFPFIFTLFLSKSIAILLKPEHVMYPLVNKVLLQKPSFDPSDFPLFYACLYSSNESHASERAWMLRLTAEGLKDEASFDVYKKWFVLESVMFQLSSKRIDYGSIKLAFQVLMVLIQLPCLSLDWFYQKNFFPYLIHLWSLLPNVFHPTLIDLYSLLLSKSIAHSHSIVLPILFSHQTFLIQNASTYPQTWTALDRLVQFFPDIAQSIDCRFIKMCFDNVPQEYVKDVVGTIKTLPHTCFVNDPENQLDDIFRFMRRHK